MRRLIGAVGLVALAIGAAGCGGTPAAGHTEAASAADTVVTAQTAPGASTATPAPDDFGMSRATGPRHATEPEAGVAASDDSATATSRPEPEGGSASSGGASPTFSARPRRQPRPRVTFVGDSVPDALAYVPDARAALAHGTRSLRLDLKVCRRLWTTSCPYQGSTPSTALDAVRSRGRGLGDVLIVDVGYNDDGSTYANGMRALINAANSAGVRGIVWVTLHEARPYYRTINSLIRSVARHAPNVVVADWNAQSAGKPWFGSDGLHLNNAGTEHLASFLRPYVQLAAAR